LLEIGGRADHGFDEPLGLLSDCHRRIEWFLDALLRVSRGERGRPLSDAGRRAMEQALTYFAAAAPRHTADEEESLFPRLRASGSEEATAVLVIVERLEGEHRRADAAHAAVSRLTAPWIETGQLGDAEASELVETLEALQRIYDSHIAIEDREVFPAASRLLSSAQLEGVGREMAERRGVRHQGVIARFFAADHRAWTRCSTLPAASRASCSCSRSTSSGRASSGTSPWRRSA
jgi:hemerythrin-like domain-containing protein